MTQRMECVTKVKKYMAQVNLLGLVSKNFNAIAMINGNKK